MSEGLILWKSDPRGSSLWRTVALGMDSRWRSSWRTASTGKREGAGAGLIKAQNSLDWKGPQNLSHGQGYLLLAQVAQSFTHLNTPFFSSYSNSYIKRDINLSCPDFDDIKTSSF